MRGQVKTAIKWELLERDEDDLYRPQGAAGKRFNEKKSEAVSLSAVLKFNEKLTKLQRGQIPPFEVGLTITAYLSYVSFFCCIVWLAC
jgi:hypothetical protein